MNGEEVVVTYFRVLFLESSKKKFGSVQMRSGFLSD
jgi:hypothetical protein